MGSMSVFGTVIGGVLCVMLVPLVTLRASLGRALMLGGVVAAVTFIVGRGVAHYGIAPILGAPMGPETLAQRVLPQGWRELVFYGVFVVLALVMSILARQWRKG